MQQRIETLIEDYQNGTLPKGLFIETIEAIIAETSNLNTLSLIKGLIIDAAVLDNIALENLSDTIFDKVAPLIQTEY